MASDSPFPHSRTTTGVVTSKFSQVVYDTFTPPFSGTRTTRKNKPSTSTATVEAASNTEVSNGENPKGGAYNESGPTLPSIVSVVILGGRLH
ncbi:hypothetical protein EYC84_000402 [Monilinia fructicola]|uniref:Uncharacterized protein n=1 Tax=Monilinia fructicola TaxID=38448 RepID=A0A5M9JQS0_MONFR|nr:hypothetical protein EYC84_000402 [Monilinia fructicola]